MTILGEQLARRCGAHLDGRYAICDAGVANMPTACGQHPVTALALHNALLQIRCFAFLPLAERSRIVERQERDRFPIMDCPYRTALPELRGAIICTSAAMQSALRAEEKAHLAAVRRRVQANAQVARAATASCGAGVSPASTLDPVLRTKVAAFARRRLGRGVHAGYRSEGEKIADRLEQARQRERDRARLYPHARRRVR